MTKRVLTAIVLLLITIPCIYFSNYTSGLIATIFCLIGNYEIIKLTGKNYNFFEKAFSYLLVLFPICSLFNTETNNILLMIFLTTLLIYCGFVVVNDKNNVNDVFIHFVVTLLLQNCIYLFSTSRQTSLFLLVVTILTDTFALFGGMLLGKHKLAEKISPKKTVEGAICGSLFSTLLVCLFIYFTLHTFNIFIIITILLLTIVSQIGDLFYSVIKRHYNVKDFGNLLPGHGGALDRIDSISFVFTAYLIISLIIKVI